MTMASPAIIDPAALAVGAKSADSFSPDWTNAPATVAQNTSWTIAQTRYLLAQDSAKWVLRSVATARDMAVTTYVRLGRVYLRLDATGKAIYFSLSNQTARGELRVGIVTGATDATYNAGTFYESWVSQDLLALIPGFRLSPTDGDTFTFGVEGCWWYARWNGIEFLRVPHYQHMAEGAVGLKGNGTGYRRVEAVFSDPVSLHGDYPATGRVTVDLRDMGIRAVQGTGSMAAGSATLTLDAPAAFAVGDPVIVEIGGEAGQGLRGTVGVGGVYPSLSYVDQAAMLADTSRPQGTYAWLQSTGETWWWSPSSAWQRLDESLPPAARYYVAKALPLALRATVIVINGLILTLSAPALAATTGARVYRDNAPTLHAVLQSPRFAGWKNLPDPVFGVNDWTAITPAAVTARIPDGVYACGAARGILVTDRADLAIVGAGKDRTRLVSPRGCRSMTLRLVRVERPEVAHLALQGNWGDNSYMLTEAVTQTAQPQGLTYPWGLRIESVQDGSGSGVHDVDILDSPQSLSVSMAVGLWSRRVQILAPRLRAYLQWQAQYADVTGGGVEDVWIDSPLLQAGFEMFKCRETLFRRVAGRNVSAALNSASGVWDGLDLRVEAGANRDNASFSASNPLVNLNTNTGGGFAHLGATLRHLRLAQEGYIDDGGGVLLGVVVNLSNPDVWIEDGEYSAPDWSPGAANNGAIGVNSIGDRTTVKRFRAVGIAAPPWCNLNIRDGALIDCAGTWRVTGQTPAPVITTGPAQYRARIDGVTLHPDGRVRVTYSEATGPVLDGPAGVSLEFPSRAEFIEAARAAAQRSAADMPLVLAYRAYREDPLLGTRFVTECAGRSSALDVMATVED